MRKRSQRDVVQGPDGLVGQCLFRHKPAPYWVMRPPVVGAGVVIPKVHFDRACLRCRQTAERVWAPITGETGPLPEAMTLTAWLDHHGATVERPAGEVRTPISPLDNGPIAG